MISYRKLFKGVFTLMVKRIFNLGKASKCTDHFDQLKSHMISDLQCGGGCNPFSRVNLAVQEYDWVIITNLRKETDSPLQDYNKMYNSINGNCFSLSLLQFQCHMPFALISTCFL